MADIEENKPSKFVKPALKRMPSAEERLVYQKNPHLLNAANFQPRVADGIKPSFRIPHMDPEVPVVIVPPTTPATTTNAPATDGAPPSPRGGAPPSPRGGPGGPAPKLGHTRKFSSTATIYAKNTIKAPDVHEIVKCLAKALYWNIKNNEQKEPKRFRDIFDEQKHPLGDGKSDFTKSPDELEIIEFLQVVFSSQNLSAECGVMAAAYIERLVRLTGITLHATNWRRITVGALLLAAKVWEDLAVWNVDWLEGTFHNLSVQDLNLLEREFLQALQFTVSLKSSVYAKYYFDLRALSDVDDEHFPVKPLDVEGAKALEAKSLGLEESKRGHFVHEKRSQSLHSLSPLPTHKTLSIEELRTRFGGQHIEEDDD